LEKYPISKKKCPEMESGSEVMSILKSTNFQHFSEMTVRDLQSFIQTSHGMGFGYSSLQ
jgi:hypothetical protein